MGGVMQDEQGKVLWVMVECMETTISVEIAEACAVRLGVSMAREKGVTKLVVEMDSQIVFFALQNSKADHSYFGDIVDDILQRCSDFDSLKFSWVRCSANKAAHFMANYAFNCSSLFFSASIPEAAVDIVNSDFSV